MGRLGSSVWVSFQIFALRDGGNVLAGERNCPGVGNIRGICPREEMCRGKMPYARKIETFHQYIYIYIYIPSCISETMQCSYWIYPTVPSHID